MKKIKTLAAAAVVAVSLFSMQGDAMAAEDNTISVRGIAKQEVAPDMAYLTLGISVKGDTAESVRTQAAEASQKVRRALLGMAISENNIQSSSYNLYPDYENVNGKNKQKGYALNTTLRIKVDDLKKLGDIIDKTVQEGVTNVNQVSFALSEESNVQRQLLAAAVDNATHRRLLCRRARQRLRDRLGDCRRRRRAGDVGKRRAVRRGRLFAIAGGGRGRLTAPHWPAPWRGRASSAQRGEPDVRP